MTHSHEREGTAPSTGCGNMQAVHQINAVLSLAGKLPPEQAG